ncbi:16S rRNA (cytosine(1402)-N(4))-methyltransferase RsmH [Oceanicella actignis]|uniref:Ribosomal RNA small subunit methyltransferase H n=1 Tax=Oceanicella actignis TaxID=1189325 RepID=A0A1M7SB37_9RHOB|nr:16S rRNA (cytosine(1402)-N(4))-methyltransferase RsmH [Oceanicella actignis]TYO91524.1 16S rRNA (cytosine1402-N4)-methyltransferase [Oceanicella actignis]SET28045.1 16S rRNA (cytosine1402-N4)-methyltransferase [Oceanicella actignis]SHN55729.1 16S rRNA (cytosine1402-N4)-methyltransferase [Oceanicella actignis]
MSGDDALARARAAHAPVMLDEVLAALAPEGGGAWEGAWLDGTLGAGGYARAILERGARRLVAIDRDPEAVARAREWAGIYGERLVLVHGAFGDLDRHAAPTLAELGAPGLAGVVLDIGVSSMQIDQPERGFSFQKDGPLDMRMAQEGPSAADLVNRAEEADLADILHHYGEERAARRIARAIVAARREGPIETTLRLARIVESCLPRPRPGQPHPATRSFQALRIAVNDELGELIRALSAAERALAPGGTLAVVTFHSLEDRIVKRFFQQRAGGAPGGSRHAPRLEGPAPSFRLLSRKAATASEEELARNPRARSARLRAARRTDAPPVPADPASLGAPRLGDLAGLMRRISR